MRTSLNLLDDIRIASPCSARWDDMAGDVRARHCGACDRTVYDLSRLTAGQAADLIREKEGSLCVRLFRRADGRVLTANCPVGLGDQLRRLRDGAIGTPVGWIVAAVVSFLLGGLTLLRFGMDLPPGGLFGGFVQGGICPPPGFRAAGPREGPMLHEPKEVENDEGQPDAVEKKAIPPQPREVE
ncbi:MAG: hypothetical protein ACRC33_04930 [Gemmataceae bacterium]